MSDLKEIERDIEKLEEYFASISGAIIAFSGGVDSSLVAYLARQALGKENMLAVISGSSSLKSKDLREAKVFCAEHDISLEVIKTAEMDNLSYRSNPVDRCFHCKHTLYEDLAAIMESYPSYCLMNGQNSDDSSDYRPGAKAAEKFEVRSPLAECEISKQGIRRIATHYKLSCKDKPASPCLSSRIPYGQEITIEKLRQVEEAEEYLDSRGFPVSRLRHYGDKAVVEVPVEQIPKLNLMKDDLEHKILSLGFDAVVIDQDGFSSGKLNKVAGITE